MASLHLKTPDSTETTTNLFLSTIANKSLALDKHSITHLKSKATTQSASIWTKCITRSMLNTRLNNTTTTTFSNMKRSTSLKPTPWLWSVEHLYKGLHIFTARLIIQQAYKHLRTPMAETKVPSFSIRTNKKKRKQLNNNIIWSTRWITILTIITPSLSSCNTLLKLKNPHKARADL